VPTIQVTDGEYEFLKDYGKYVRPGRKVHGKQAVKIGLRTMIEDYLIRDHSFGREGLEDRLKELR
jgi:hypothetical protein